MEKLENLRKAASILLNQEVEGVTYRQSTGGYGMYFVKWNGDVLSKGLSATGATPDEAYAELCKKVYETAKQSRDKAEDVLKAVKELVEA